MVFTLHRYLFRELLKVFVPAVVALTIMLSLGSILRPVQRYGIGPQQVLHLMGYFLPVTLTFVMPIAALFACSLVYGRLASDNELEACRASGISLPTLVYPGLALAIMVAVANLILSFHVMPTFVHRAAKAIKADAKNILFRNLNRRGYYELPPDGRYLIYADVADPRNDMLSGVVVIKLGQVGIEKIITAESAGVHFNPERKFNEVQITAYNTYQMDPQGEEAFAQRLSITTEFGSLLGDDIKFKKLNEMKRIRDVDLMLFDPIARLARRVYARFTIELLAQDIEAKITDSSNSFYVMHTGRKIVEFTASGCGAVGDKKLILSGEVVVKEYSVADKKYLQTLRCKKAELHLEGDELVPTVTMELYNPAWQRPDGSKGLAYRHYIRGLIPPEAVTGQFKSENTIQAIRLASNSPALKNTCPDLLKELQRKIRRTLAEIKAEMHSRLVFGVGCVTMIMIGIGLGIIFKGGHLLSAFGISCVPAAVLMVCILMGKNIAKNPGSQTVSGTTLMWAGFVFLSLLALAVYHRLLKN